MTKLIYRTVGMVMLLVIALPASATIIKYDMLFSDPISATVTGGAGVLTVDLPGVFGSDTCNLIGGCGSPPAFSVFVSFEGTVNGIDFLSTDLFQVTQSNTIEYSPVDLLSFRFNMIKPSGEAFRSSLPNGIGLGIWDWVDGNGVSGLGVVNLSRASSTSAVPLPASLSLILLGLMLIGVLKRHNSL